MKKKRNCFNCGIEGIANEDLIEQKDVYDPKDNFYSCSKHECLKWIDREIFKRNQI